MRRLLLSALTLAALLSVTTVALPAHAEMSDAERAKRWFLEHDRNQDGYITIDEVMGYEQKLFKRMDSQGVGRVREDQYCAGIPATNTVELDRCHVRFTRIDAEGDGYITLKEIEDFYRAALDAADQDKDGQVSLDEFMAATQGQ
jgi:Ca2+-binding EF-hand superfamily protein